MQEECRRMQSPNARSCHRPAPITPRRKSNRLITPFLRPRQSFVLASLISSLFSWVGCAHRTLQTTPPHTLHVEENLSPLTEQTIFAASVPAREASWRATPHPNTLAGSAVRPVIGFGTDIRAARTATSGAPLDSDTAGRSTERNAGRVPETGSRALRPQPRQRQGRSNASSLALPANHTMGSTCGWPPRQGIVTRQRQGRSMRGRGGLTRKGLTCGSPSLHEHTRVKSVKTLRFALLLEQSPQVEPVTPADPLLIYYHVHVPLCSYKDGALMGHPTHFIAAGGEDLRDAFDTVVVTNVLEHCQDALRALQNLHGPVRPAGGLRRPAASSFPANAATAWSGPSLRKDCGDGRRSPQS